MIELSGISKSYNKGAVKAVNNLSLTVRPGEIFGFLALTAPVKPQPLK